MRCSERHEEPNTRCLRVLLSRNRTECGCERVGVACGCGRVREGKQSYGGKNQSEGETRRLRGSYRKRCVEERASE